MNDRAVSLEATALVVGQDEFYGIRESSVKTIRIGHRWVVRGRRIRSASTAARRSSRPSTSTAVNNVSACVIVQVAAETRAVSERSSASGSFDDGAAFAGALLLMDRDIFLHSTNTVAVRRRTRTEEEDEVVVKDERLR